jgi:hypothetical protein
MIAMDFPSERVGREKRQRTAALHDAVARI